jgi:AAA domain, putative AbiEii toxin, Type IV TA system/AAA ATPase domain
MYSRISIKNFRGIGSLEVDGLRRINLIVGRNNSGKTTFLESLFLLGGANDPRYTTILGRLRGQRLRRRPDQVWRSLFHNMDPKASPEISGHWAQEPRDRILTIGTLDVSSYTGSFELPNGGGSGVAAVNPEFLFGGVQFRTTDSGGNVTVMEARLDPNSRIVTLSGARRSDVVRTTLLGARNYPDQVHDAQTFSSLRKVKGDLDILQALTILEPRVQRIEVLSEITGPSIYLDIGLEALVPLAVYGEGLVRLFSITVELAASRNGVLLIDEIDNGLHYSIMPHLWQLLGQLVVKQDVQIFATTHNDDMMRSALEAFAGTEGMLGLFRIDKRGERHVMVSYSEEAMKGILEDHFEVRG